MGQAVYYTHPWISVICRADSLHGKGPATCTFRGLTVGAGCLLPSYTLCDWGEFIIVFLFCFLTFPLGCVKKLHFCQTWEVNELIARSGQVSKAVANSVSAMVLFYLCM